MAHRDDLGVTEDAAVGAVAFVGDEDLVAVRDEVDEIEALDPLAVWPAILEISAAVNPVVEKTCEVKVLAINFSIAVRSFAAYAS